MKLYFSPGACSLSPHIVLREAGLPFTTVKVDLKTKAMDGGGDYRAIHPKGYVPLLELDDGARLSEGPAIAQYLADRVPQAKLAPAAKAALKAEGRTRRASSMQPGGETPPIPALSRRAGEGRSRRARDLTDGEPE